MIFGFENTGSTKTGPVHPLEIKRGALVRTLKDYEMYKSQMTEAQAKYESLKNSECDAHELSRARDVVDECNAVLKYTGRRLGEFAADLDNYIRESILPVIDSPEVPPMCKAIVREVKKYLDDLTSKYPEVGFKFASKAA